MTEPMMLSPMTLGDLITWLERQDPDEQIAGVAPELFSYRGYYEHVCMELGNFTTEVGTFLDVLKCSLGETMEGYKGGEYTISEDCFVFVAPIGDTGPSLAGFRVVIDQDGEVWQPILIDSSRWYLL